MYQMENVKATSSSLLILGTALLHEYCVLMRMFNLVNNLVVSGKVQLIL